jgi:phenylalanyl-tRNA synthetase beta chain
VAGRSRRFNFSTDAGHRFERGVDPALTVEHIERITRLVIDICGGAAGPMDDQTMGLPERQPVVMRVERAAKIIGMPVTQAQCEGVMQRLGLPFTSAPGVLTVTPPSWRFDIQIEEDLIEEVIRVIGYASLPDSPPLAPVTARVRSEARRGLHTLCHSMATLDYQETINYSFVEERWEHELAGNAQPIRVLNPIASPLAVLRSSLFGSLVNVLRFNLARKATRVRVFEIGRVFMRDAAAVDSDATVAGLSQPRHLAGLAYGSADAMQWAAKERAADFFDLKGDIESLLSPRRARFVPAEHPALHPGRCARVEVDGVAIGFAGELHPKWRQAYELPTAPLLFELDLSALLERDIPSLVQIQRQQSAWRDIAVIAGEAVTHEALMQTITEADRMLVRSARLFDIYKPATPTADIGAGERSLAVRLEVLDDEATLTDERIDGVVSNVLKALNQCLGVRLRG